ncbi:sensor histidine kinase [Planococcus sp. FY231025]|uniref:sensor histidine kinase n=1 Tax=Planococcus sp. FY231025 TaxID=3455699 RepID=UPI003F92C94F
MGKNKSIKFRLLLILVILSSVFLAGNWVSNNANNDIRHEYNLYLDKNTKLSTLPVLINELATNFDILTRNRGKETIAQIRLLNGEVSSILDSIEPTIKNDRESLMYFRALSNMHTYQQEKVKNIILVQQYDSESYKDVVYIKSLYNYMNSSSQSLMMSYQESSSKNYAQAMEEIRKEEVSINSMLVLFGFFSMIFAFMLSKDIFKTLKELSTNAKLLANGEWHMPDIPQIYYKELDHVANAFNKMKEDINIYIMEVNKKAEVELQLQKQSLLTIEKEKLLKESQLLNLQMQMNPHFLFNTLNMVGRTAMLEDNQSTIKLIESISVMLRFNLENEGKMVPLEDELNALQAYIFIQGMRFQERITICLNNEMDMEPFLIPPLSLQPIVENCLIHGLYDIKSGGEVNIRISGKEDAAEITIQDNGKGIDEERLNWILNSEEEEQLPREKKKSIGLANVKKRLELTFNQEDLMQIKSTLNEGTTVHIKLPRKVR